METGYFGCPLGEERDTEVIGGARVQDFERGRIYGSLLGTAPPHTAYVPLVFVDALNKRGGEPVNGLPRGDPTDSIGPSRPGCFNVSSGRTEQTSCCPRWKYEERLPRYGWNAREGIGWWDSWNLLLPIRP